MHVESLGHCLLDSLHGIHNTSREHCHKQQRSDLPNVTTSFLSFSNQLPATFILDVVLTSWVAASATFKKCAVSSVNACAGRVTTDLSDG